MDSKAWNSQKGSDKLKTLLRSAGLSLALAQASWSSLTKAEKMKIERASKGSKGWHEEKAEVPTKEGIKKVAPRHREVAVKKALENTERVPMVAPEPIKEEKPPAPRKEEKKELYGTALVEDLTTRAHQATTLAQIEAVEKEFYDAQDYRLVAVKYDTKETLKTLIKNKIALLKLDTAVYESLITKLKEAKTLKESGEVHQNATREQMRGKISFDQLQAFYAMAHEKDEYLSRENETAISIWQMRIETAKTDEEVYEAVREANKSNISQGYKTQIDTLAKKKIGQLWEEAQRSESDLTIVNDFKAQINQARTIDRLKELNVEIVDAVAKGKFAKAKVVSADIHNLHELVNSRMSQIFTEAVDLTKSEKAHLEVDFTIGRTPSNLIKVSTEVTRLKELAKRVHASPLTQSRKDTLGTLINSRINSAYASLKQDVPSIDTIGDVKQSDAYKMLLLAISEFKTLDQVNAFSKQLNIKMKLLGVESVEDPRISDMIKLLSAKRAQLAGTGTTVTKIIRQADDYEIKNLQYEAEHKPPEMLPPKPIEDPTKYTWGVTEPEAIKKLVEAERKKYQSNIDYTNRQGAECAAMAKEKPWVLLTRAWIEKNVPKEEVSAKLSDLWNYKSKKSSFDKNTNAARYWQDKVNKIVSGEWATINNNYLRERYQKEVKEAIKHGKPVPYDVIKQYPEFTKAQDARERYDKGRHTSFANVSIAVDTRHQENHGVKIKMQDGKAMDDKHADEIIRVLSQYQSVVGDITPIMKRENLTISHTRGKHPFLSDAAGCYHPTDVTVTLGMNGVGAHEMTHMVDETAKRRHRDQPLYDYNLIAFAKKNMNGGVYAVERAISLSKSKSPEELEKARKLRFMLGTYWKRVEEVWARLIEQYTAYKNKELPAKDTALLHQEYEDYTILPAWWDDEIFKVMLPQIEAELKRKIELAKN